MVITFSFIRPPENKHLPHGSKNFPCIHTLVYTKRGPVSFSGQEVDDENNTEFGGLLHSGTLQLGKQVSLFP